MTTKKSHIFVALLLTIYTLTSCTETKTSDAKDTYKYWAGTNPPADLELLNGQYWGSSHWSKEYKMYLKFKPTNIWWDEFLKQNSISKDNGNWTVPSDAPFWFKPSDNSVRFRGSSDFDQGSRFFRDSISGICYIYEIQL
jgi:hypothetical protein